MATSSSGPSETSAETIARPLHTEFFPLTSPEDIDWSLFFDQPPPPPPPPPPVTISSSTNYQPLEMATATTADLPVIDLTAADDSEARSNPDLFAFGPQSSTRPSRPPNVQANIIDVDALPDPPHPSTAVLRPHSPELEVMFSRPVPPELRRRRSIPTARRADAGPLQGAINFMRQVPHDHGALTTGNPSSSLLASSSMNAHPHHFHLHRHIHRHQPLRTRYLPRPHPIPASNIRSAYLIAGPAPFGESCFRARSSGFKRGELTDSCGGK